MPNKYKGSTFDSFLGEESLLEEVEALAIKRVIAHELNKILQHKQISKTQMAVQLQTSRSALDRLLDPSNLSITLRTLLKAAHILGKN